MAFPENFLQELIERNDIVDVVGSYVRLTKKSGSNQFGLCPFHSEKTPSFSVSPDKQIYHCFGCGKGGDVFRFMMDKENLPFPDALQILASRAGIILPEKSDRSGGDGSSKQRSDERERLFAINEKFSEFFCKNRTSFPDSPAAKYLRDRGIPEEIAQRFKIGCAPDGWTAGLEFGRRCKFSDADMLKAGVIRFHEDSGRLFDQFRGRLMFTIENEHGRGVGFSGRTLEPKPQDGRKYVNTGDTPVFHKGHLLYALPLARQAMGRDRCAVLCEGQLDTIAFHRAGIQCAVAPLGTAFTPDQARILRRYTDRMVLAFDSDGAGQKAVLRAAEILLPLGVELKVMRIPGGKDPDELYRTSGPEALQEALANSVGWLEIVQEGLGTAFDMESASGRGRAAAYIANYLRLIPNPVELELSVRRTAEMLRVSEAAVSAELDRIRDQNDRRENFREERRQSTASSSKPARDPLHQELLGLLELAINSENAARKLAELLPEGEPSSDNPAGAALNIVIGAALNEEFSEAPGQINTMLLEHPDPDVSRVLMTHCDATDRVDEAVPAAFRNWRLAWVRRRKSELLQKLRQETDPDLRGKLLAEINAIR